MKLKDRKVKKQLFICCNERENGKVSCGNRDDIAIGLIKKLKDKLKEDHLWEQYKVTKSGCLGPCSQGVNALLFPENIMISNLEMKNFDELYSFLTRKESV